MKLETLDPADIEIQTGYNVRSPKDLKANTRAIALEMELSGDNHEDPRFIVRYVQNGQHKYTRSHATLAAAQERGWKKVVAQRLPWEVNSTEDIADLIRSNNRANPLPVLEVAFACQRLRDGIMETEEQVLARTKAGEVLIPAYIKEPMSLAEVRDAIAVMDRDKLTEARVSQLCAMADVFHLSPEIAELVGEGAIAPGVLPTVQAWATKSEGDEPKPGKMLAIVRAAIRVAKEEGKECATRKHLDAIKLEFVTLKASGAKTPAKPAKAADKGETAPKTENEPQDAPASAGKPAQATMDLATEQPKPKKNGKPADIRQGIIDVLQAVDDELSATWAERFADALVKAGCVFATSPI